MKNLITSARATVARQLTLHKQGETDIDGQPLDHDCYGIHVAAHPSCHFPNDMGTGIFIERCDALSIFDGDEAAAKAAGLRGAWVACDVSDHFRLEEHR